MVPRPWATFYLGSAWSITPIYMYFRMIKNRLAEIWVFWKTFVVSERNMLGTSTLRGFVEDMVVDRIHFKKLKFHVLTGVVFQRVSGKP